MKIFVLTAIAVSASSLMLSSCGIVEIDNGCVLVKKQSEEKKELGLVFLEMADAGKVGKGLTIEEAQSQGYRYLIEGTKLVVDNPQCFTSDDVRIAKNLLGQ